MQDAGKQEGEIIINEICQRRRMKQIANDQVRSLPSFIPELRSLKCYLESSPSSAPETSGYFVFQRHSAAYGSALSGR